MIQLAFDTVGSVVVPTSSGLYCPAGDFYIDPKRKVGTAVVTHAHSDHVRKGCGRYFASASGASLIRYRLGEDISLETVPYGTEFRIGNAVVSFHPSGHILGAAQVRIEVGGTVCVVSGDYKLHPDPTCMRFESVECDIFVTEATFADPRCRWPDPEVVVEEINKWWRENAERKIPSFLSAYVMGKAQRVLSLLDRSIGPVFVTSDVAEVNRCYLEAGVDLPEVDSVSLEGVLSSNGRALVIGPKRSWADLAVSLGRKFSTAAASGWMIYSWGVRRAGVQRGFILSDHADWPSLFRAVKATCAQRVWITHGLSNKIEAALNSAGIEAVSV